MTQINLLPWREKIRKKQYFRFGVELFIFIAITLIITTIINIYFATKITYYTDRAEFLKKQLGAETIRLKTLKDRTQNMEETTKDLQYILTLKKTSYQAVRQLDELVRVIPRNVQLKKITRKKAEITLTGRVNSHLQVTLLMKNIAKSTVFRNPRLTKITNSRKGTEEKDFVLTIDTIPE